VEITVDGKRAFVATGNYILNAERRTIVFVHGTGQDHTIWRAPKRYFNRAGFNVLDLDLPNHGSSMGPGFHRIEQMADWIVRVLDDLQLASVVMVGHSMGSLVAFDMAARYTERVEKLVLVATSMPMPVTDELMDAAVADHPDVVDMLTFWGHSPAGHRGGVADLGIWMLGADRRLFERAGRGVIRDDLVACREYTDGMERASQVRCPTLLLLGQIDLMTPAYNAKELVETLADCRTETFAGCGHAMLSERADEVLDALKKFV
jgi:pimeloyl-ACP methyl ester carboxylesterase